MNKKFLSLPVSENSYVISEGWQYSKEERSIHGISNHLGIDYACHRGTKVLAGSSGWAIASYKNRPFINEKTGEEVIYKGKKITCSRGYFVQIYHPETDFFTEYYHLEKNAHTIPFAKPVKHGNTFLPVGNDLQAHEYETYKMAVWVEQGDVIGYVGDSGLTWGYEDYPKRPDPDKFPSWDETHVHFKVSTRDSKGKEKEFDPYDIYKSFSFYPWPSHNKVMGKNHLWQKIKKGLPN